MNLMFFYKIAKKKKDLASSSLQRINVPEIQKNKIMEAENVHGEKIERMVSPHTPIDPLATQPTAKEAQEDFINTIMTGHANGLLRFPTLNPEYKKNYIKQLFIANKDNNFNVSGDEDII